MNQTDTDQKLPLTDHDQPLGQKSTKMPKNDILTSTRFLQTPQTNPETSSQTKSGGTLSDLT